MLFAGYQYDKETGLYYLNARMYDPVTARFMQEDTYAGQQSDPLSLNLYTYCHNSPLMYWDPTGHWAEELQLSGQGDSSYFQGGGGMPSWAIHTTQNYLKAKDLCSKLPNETSRKALMKMYDESVDSTNYYSSSDNAISDFSRTLEAIDGVTQHPLFEDYYGIVRRDTIASNIAEDKNRLSSSAIEWDTIKTMVDDYTNMRFGVYAVDPVTVSDGTNTYSGGDQNWFASNNPRYTDSISSQLSEFGVFIAGTNVSGGCGIVCATDIMAILAQQPGYASLFSSVSSTYSTEEYFRNMETMSNYVVPWRTYLDFSINNPFTSDSYHIEYYPQGIKIPIINKDYDGTVGVFPQSRFYKGVQTYAQERNVDLYAHSLTAADGKDFNAQSVKNEIATALTQGYPVALQVGFMANVDWMEDLSQTGIYTPSPYSTSAHWVTVVGMQADEDGQTILKVLTWGEERYIDLDNFVQSACQKPTIIGEMESKSHGIVWFGPESENGLFFQR